VGRHCCDAPAASDIKNLYIRPADLQRFAQDLPRGVVIDGVDVASKAEKK
jgi:hypothetical protein